MLTNYMYFNYPNPGWSVPPLRSIFSFLRTKFRIWTMLYSEVLIAVLNIVDYCRFLTNMCLESKNLLKFFHFNTDFGMNLHFLIFPTE